MTASTIIGATIGAVLVISGATIAIVGILSTPQARWARPPVGENPHLPRIGAGSPAAGMIPLAARMLLERLRNGRRGRHIALSGSCSGAFPGGTAYGDLSENNIETI